ncbi:uncharacterized protein LOC121883594 [Thunnus maccoyii]|uniref:uncharacterized protein LOC121883594 n=1 Tax=Thunnus maccoyii TaxID=8240 RepID=UPI001C4C1DE9|nr:uncharacterized protein LOC121883594 [Thunnus maccoyii]
MKWFTVYQAGFTYIQTELSADGNRVTYNMSEESHPNLTINGLRDSDAKFYCCINTTETPELCWHNRTKLRVADLQVKVIPATEGQTVSLICKTSCPLTENPAAYIWYKNREFLYQDWSPWYQQLVSSEEAVRYSCAIKDYEHLRAPEVSVDSVTSTCFTVTYTEGRMCSYKQTSVDESCSITYPRGVDYKNCWSVNYIRRRICALEGSSVNISSEYLYPDNQQPESKVWYKMKRSGEEEAVETTEDAVRVQYLDNMNNQHILRIKNLKKTDSAEYIFRLQKDRRRLKGDPPGVTLIVSGLEVKLHPAVVTEGQRVTLTCSTSCPLTDNTNYIWYLNSQSLMVPENQNKHLVLDPYHRNINSSSWSCYSNNSCNC